MSRRRRAEAIDWRAPAARTGSWASPLARAALYNGRFHCGGTETKMTDVAARIEHHYGRGHTLDRLRAALAQAGTDPDKLGYQDLWPFDQLHSRGIAATREHAERAELRADMRVLDLGCGIGGSSRYLASALGCRVTGVDLTREYIEVARELTRRCGLTNRIDYQVADALALPFADGSFDHVYSHNVTMNIEDKTGLAAEVARVLKHGGAFSCSELGRGAMGDVSY